MSGPPASEIVALGSLVNVEATTWELGVLVEDSYQGVGIGSCLIDLLVRSVPPRQCTSLVADALADRRHLLARLARYGVVAVTDDHDVAHTDVIRCRQTGADFLPRRAS